MDSCVVRMSTNMSMIMSNYVIVYLCMYMYLFYFYKFEISLCRWILFVCAWIFFIFVILCFHCRLIIHSCLRYFVCQVIFSAICLFLGVFCCSHFVTFQFIYYVSATKPALLHFGSYTTIPWQFFFSSVVLLLEINQVQSNFKIKVVKKI